MGYAGSYGMYLASQSGLVSSVSNIAGVTQYDNVETQTRAFAPSASALSPEAGIFIYSFMHTSNS